MNHADLLDTLEDMTFCGILKKSKNGTYTLADGKVPAGYKSLGEFFAMLDHGGVFSSDGTKGN